MELLQKYKTDPVVEVAETCELALDRIKWLQSGEKQQLTQNPYHSIDPAPPMPITDLNKLKEILLNNSESLFERYRAMFALRNIGNKEAIEIICMGLKTGSALFRHEIAFVLGQLQNQFSVKSLTESLEDCTENEMVRHECAEALGAIATDDCLEVLNKYLCDEKRVVKESCEIALDMCEYENSPEFQYANTLQITAQK